jgi:hypothetical protein
MTFDLHRQLIGDRLQPFQINYVRCQAALLQMVSFQKQQGLKITTSERSQKSTNFTAVTTVLSNPSEHTLALLEPTRSYSHP